MVSLHGNTSSPETRTPSKFLAAATTAEECDYDASIGLDSTTATSLSLSTLQ
jgi:hypothetical protein